MNIVNPQDWETVDIAKAKLSLYSCHNSKESVEILKKFINSVELLKKKQIKQTAVLLKEGGT